MRAFRAGFPNVPRAGMANGASAGAASAPSPTTRATHWRSATGPRSLVPGAPVQVGLTSTLLGGVGRDAKAVVRRIVHSVAVRCGDPNPLKDTLRSMKAD